MKSGIKLKILGFTALFLVALFVLFPINNLRGYIFDRVFKSSGVLLVSDSMHFSLFGMPGVRMENVNVTLPIGDQEIDLWSQNVTLKLALSGLFPPLPGGSVKISELKKGGDIYTKIGKGQNSIAFHLNATQVNLEQIGTRNGNPPLKGLLNISSDIIFNETEVIKSSGYFKISIKDLLLIQQTISPPELGGLTIIIPTMKIGKLNGTLNMKNGVLEVAQFKFGEDPNSDLKGILNGDFKLEKKIELSALNIGLTLKLSQRILDNPEAATFKSALTGFQIAPGEYSLKCNGTIQDFINSPLYPCKKMD